MEWFNLIIPLACAIYLYIWHRQQAVAWEYLVLFGVSPLLILGLKSCGESSLVTDTEFWGGFVHEARYYEAWDEYIHQTCYRDVPCGTDSKGNTTYCSEPYDCSYVEDHPPYWEVRTVYHTNRDAHKFRDDDQFVYNGSWVTVNYNKTENDTTWLGLTNGDTLVVNRGAQFKSNFGERVYVNEATYKKLVRKFGQTPVKVDMHRNYHSYDGDMFKVRWSGTKKTAEPLITEHTYENRIQASDTNLKWEKPDEQDVAYFNLYDYPEIHSYYQLQTIQGGQGIKNYHAAEKEFNFLNGKLGPEVQCRIFVLIYRNQSMKTANIQRAYWEGGNKNEFTICIGIDSTTNQVQWCKPFSWSPKSESEKLVRNYVIDNFSDKPLDLLAVANASGDILKGFVRDQWEQYSWIRVKLPLWQLILITIITLLANIGMSVWIVQNDIEEGGTRNRYRFRRY